jgi:ribosome-associated toxin RatA of RatAB toxin-antitoxin module
MNYHKIIIFLQNVDSYILMKTVHTTNSKVVPYPATRIWDCITDFSNYSSWWPPSIKIKTLRISEGNIGSRIEVRPYGGQAFCCEVSSINDRTELTMAYSGIYSGTGKWTISEVNGQTCVTYEIDLRIESILIRMLSSVLSVTSVHSRLMEEVLSGLTQYLGQIDKRAGQGAV